LIKNFADIKGHILTVTTRKHAIIFSRRIEENGDLNFSYAVFQEFITFLKEQVNECWSNFKPKEASSFGSDYAEYYDSKLKNDGSLLLGKNRLSISRPVEGNVRCYKFNKTKMQSFMFDLLRREDQENDRKTTN